MEYYRIVSTKRRSQEQGRNTPIATPSFYANHRIYIYDVLRMDTRYTDSRFWGGIGRSTPPYNSGVLRSPIARNAGLQYTGEKAPAPRSRNAMGSPAPWISAGGGMGGGGNPNRATGPEQDPSYTYSSEGSESPDRHHQGNVKRKPTQSFFKGGDPLFLTGAYGAWMYAASMVRNVSSVDCASEFSLAA